MGLLERLEEAMQTAGLSGRALERAAGLSDRHLAVVIHRQRTKPESGIDSDTLFALARALRVNTQWLKSGAGPRDASVEDVAQLAPENDAGQDPPSTVGMSDYPSYAAVPVWPAVLKAARIARPQRQSWVWERIAATKPLIEAMPTVASIVEYSDWVERHDTPPPEGIEPRDYYRGIREAKRRVALEKLK